MATPRTDGTPYGAFNFQLIADRIGNSNPGTVQAGFQEISAPGMEVNLAEYRTGNWTPNVARKVALLSKPSGDITLKRGLIGYTDMWGWISDLSAGNLATQPMT